MANITVPNTFVNNTQIADATQVNANFNSVLSGLVNSTNDFNFANLAVASAISANGPAGFYSSVSFIQSATYSGSVYEYGTHTQYGAGQFNSSVSFAQSAIFSGSVAFGGSIIGPLLLGAGSASAPSFSFSANASDGLYFDSSNGGPAMSRSNAEVMCWTSARVISFQPIWLQNGSAAAPSVAGQNFSTSGLFWAAGPKVSIAISGNSLFEVDATTSTYRGQNFTHTNATSGNATTMSVLNLSNTASSSAVLEAIVGGTSGGNPLVRWTTAGSSGRQFVAGVDTSDSGTWKLAQNSNVGSSDYIKVTTGGFLTLAASGGRVGFYGVTPAARSSAYTPTNVTTDRSYDADATTTAELADVLGTLIADLQTVGLIA
jgi:hypothetical protein